jgi:hypothetical protein
MKKNIPNAITLSIKGSLIHGFKWRQLRSGRPQVTGFAVAVCRDLSDCREAFGVVLEKLSYNKEPLTLIIDHQQVTARSVSVPSQDAREVERIVLLQAGTFLPYAAEDIVAGYLSVAAGDDGYTQVYLTLAHRSVIEGYLKALETLSVDVVSVYLNSAGLAGMCVAAGHGVENEVIAVMVDGQSADFVVVRNGLPALSRWVRLAGDSVVDLARHIRDTQELYLKQSQAGPITSVVLFAEQGFGESGGSLEDRIVLPVHRLNVTVPTDIDNTLGFEPSPALVPAMLTIGRFPPQSANMLPRNRKEHERRRQWTLRTVRIGVMVFAAVLCFLGGRAVEVGKKTALLGQLNEVMADIGAESSRLNTMQRRMELLKQKQEEKYLILDFLYVLHNSAPEGLAVTDIEYESGTPHQFTVKGIAAASDTVFEYVSAMREFELFDKDGIKVNYVTTRKVDGKDRAFFELACMYR